MFSTPLDRSMKNRALVLGKSIAPAINRLLIGCGVSRSMILIPAKSAFIRTANLLLTTQYTGGSVGVYRLNSDGSIAEQTSLIKHGPGSGVVSGTQDAAHPHWSGFLARWAIRVRARPWHGSRRDLSRGHRGGHADATLRRRLRSRAVDHAT